jgi:hypothetical protein
VQQRAAQTTDKIWLPDAVDNYDGKGRKHGMVVGVDKNRVVSVAEP